jgi:hypothetical protein
VRTLLCVWIALAAPRPAPEQLIAEMLPRLDAAAGCPASKSVWCLAKPLWEKGTAADLPAAGVVPGISIGLEQKKPNAELLETEVDFSAFAVKAGKGLITDVPPESAAEKRTLASAVSAVAAALKKGGPVTLPPALARYLATLPAGASHPLSRTAAEWRMSGKAEAWIRRGPAGGWIVVEVPAEGPPGVFVSIYHDDWIKPER